MNLRSKQRRVVAQIRGGLGNQLFCYAAARRLAHVNNAELILDDTSGFARDYTHRRQFLLDRFSISARRATEAERMEPLGRYRRTLARYWASRLPFHQRPYIAQQGPDFDSRLLDLRVTRQVYLEGYWQSELYFKDIESTIRADLRLAHQPSAKNLEIAKKLSGCNSVAVHFRWLNPPASGVTQYNLSREYYRAALRVIEQKVENPRFFVFSDQPAASRQLQVMPEAQTEYVDLAENREAPHWELWLMARCQHFILANSTFSWWAAWLASAEEKIVIAPQIQLSGLAAWGFDGLLPAEWDIIC